MPIGITTDVLITCLGAVLGVVLGTRLPDSLKKALNNTIGIAAIAMGIVLILKVKNLSAVVLTLVIGSILGELVMLDDRIRKLVTGVVHKLMNGAAADEQFLAQVSAVVILFCCGGTGWYGALNEGLTGDEVSSSRNPFWILSRPVSSALSLAKSFRCSAFRRPSSTAHCFWDPVQCSPLLRQISLQTFPQRAVLLPFVPVSAWPVSKKI